ncbi:MAG: HNH endonuclease [Chelatococcus sp.]|nr:MAG: HNH endonuclease [Chelatococcus sp.]
MGHRHDRRSAAATSYRSWYWSAEWRAKAKAQLAKEPWCSRCAQQGRQVKATIANHLVPHRGNARLFWEGALESVCKPHHDSAIQSEERRGFRVGSDADGRPLDPKHPWNRAR